MVLALLVFALLVVLNARSAGFPSVGGARTLNRTAAEANAS
jgi:hypothetical protein